MRRMRMVSALLVLALAGAASSLASAGLQQAYSAVLRGDYAAAKDAIAELVKSRPDEQVKRAEDWLQEYSKVSTSRDELRQQTLDWNVEQGQQALKDGKVYLALSFAAQAQPYAADEAQFASSDWIKTLRTRVEQAATQAEKDEDWSNSLAYWSLLGRIYDKDKDVKARRESASRHARLEFLYGDDEEIDRRLKGVDRDLVSVALMRINDFYYRRPDFKKMADGALDNLTALANAKSLYDVSKKFDGIANPKAREFFVGRLEQARQRVAQSPRFDWKDLRRLFDDVKRANDEFVSLPESMLVVEFLEGAVGTLDDFTSIVWPSEASEFDKMMIGNFQGVGIQLGVDDITNRLKVVTPLEDSPALEAGLRPGDLIVEVNGDTTKGWTTDDAVRNITGPAGSVVKLTIFRPDSGERITYPLTRRQIHLKTVRGVQRLPGGEGSGWNYMLDKAEGIAYIRLTGFHPDSQEELLDALRTAEGQGMRALVFDLRHNPGGLLDVAVDTVSTFLRRGSVVSTEGAREQRQVLDVTGAAPFADLPLVVLVNEGSASASEILAGALQDQKRAMILGERTYGKGSVQRVMQLGPEARLKLTTALYYLPSGRSPHKLPDADKWGVDPDWVLKVMPKEFSRILEHERSTYVIENAEHVKKVDEKALAAQLESLKDNKDADDEEDGDEPQLLTADDITALRADPFEAPDVDPQLEEALLKLRVKLAGNLPWPPRIAQADSGTNEK